MQVLADDNLPDAPAAASNDVSAGVVTPTHCPYCAMQCGLNLVENDSQWSIEPRDFPTNNGGLCRKGWTSVELLTHPGRLQQPLLRREKWQPLEPVSWDEALGFIAEKILRLASTCGPEKIGVFGGGGLTNEKAYWLGKFARVALQTPNIDYNGRFCMASAATAGNMAFGVDRGLPFPMSDIGEADAILLVGSNVAETMPPIMQYFDRQRDQGGALIVVDPRRTPTAASAALHLQATPGTDLALANGLLYLAIQNGWIDEAFIAQRTSNWEATKRAVMSYWPDRVEQITGVPVAKLEAACKYLHQAKRALILTARGAEQHSKGSETVLAFINLALALGKVGRDGCGFGTLTGQGNGQGGREHGQKADQLPGYRKITDPQARAHIAKVWKIDEKSLPQAGVSAYELLDRIGNENGIRALLVMGSNVAVSFPRAGHIRQKLKELDLLVVADLFLSETANLADVVLPSTQWAEEEGTMTNLEGRVLRRRRATNPPPNVWSDLRILSELAARLGKARWFPTWDNRIIYEELRAASEGGIADYSGISYKKIDAQDGVFWPCPRDCDSENGTPRLFLDTFPTPDGHARFHAVVHRPAGEEPDAEFPLFLTTGRVLGHYQSGTQTRRVHELNASQPHSFVELHPALAQSLGIVDGERVQVLSRRGRATLAAKITKTIRRDTLFVPFHWGDEGCANLLTNPELDPLSKMPEFKLCAARIEKIAD